MLFFIKKISELADTPWSATNNFKDQSLICFASILIMSPPIEISSVAEAYIERETHCSHVP